MIRNNLRSTATAAVDGDVGYKTLASIGITTGDVGTSVDANTYKLIFNATKFQEALTANPDAVKKLLIGDSTTDGVLTKLSTNADNTLDPVNGYFVTRNNTISGQISDLQDSIDKKTTELSTYQTYLYNKFSAMEQLISSLNSQLDTVNNVIKQTSSNK